MSSGNNDQKGTMSKLNQIIAIEKGAKSRANQHITNAYKLIQKPELFFGITKTYDPKLEDGEKFPDEKKNVQVKAHQLLNEAITEWTNLINITATKDVSNTTAVADVKVGETVLLHSVPVTHLLFLEKQLVDLHTFIQKLPLLDPAEEWRFDENVDAFRSEETQTFKTKKVMKNHVKAEATDKHPAQVEVYNEDEVIGTWNNVKFSGALPAATVRQYLERVEELQKAVKFAREEANNVDAISVEYGEALFGFVLNG